mmetsp:Transcript_11520/g.43012  ORF Transcript_11520/g.43012 Transcript_11520/m.43012 type:complete len:336 (-) Transcript_11520:875-1882(-)
MMPLRRHWNALLSLAVRPRMSRVRLFENVMSAGRPDGEKLDCWTLLVDDGISRTRWYMEPRRGPSARIFCASCTACSRASSERRPASDQSQEAASEMNRASSAASPTSSRFKFWWCSLSMRSLLKHTPARSGAGLCSISMRSNGSSGITVPHQRKGLMSEWRPITMHEAFTSSGHTTVSERSSSSSLRLLASTTGGRRESSGIAVHSDGRTQGSCREIPGKGPKYFSSFTLMIRRSVVSSAGRSLPCRNLTRSSRSASPQSSGSGAFSPCWRSNLCSRSMSCRRSLLCFSRRCVMVAESNMDLRCACRDRGDKTSRLSSLSSGATMLSRQGRMWL